MKKSNAFPSSRQAPVGRWRRGLAALALCVCGVTSVQATFHLWEFNEVYSNADGSVQFIELFTSVNTQEFTVNHDIHSVNEDGSQTQTFTFPSNTPSPTANHFLLLATPGFEAVSGGVVPDFTIPAGFLFTAGGDLNFVGADTIDYSTLPTDGVQSLGPGGLNAVNSPRNYAGQTGEVETSTEIENPIEEVIAQGDLIIELEVIAQGLSSPLGMAAPDDGSGRAFVYDQAGFIHVLQDGVLLPDPLLVVTNRLIDFRPGYDERGLLGLATHPNFAENPLIYTYTSEPVSGPADFTTPLPGGEVFNHQSVVAEWRLDEADSNLVDPGTRRELLRVDQPQFNHNGGALRFGRDGFLYVALGDGGFADDQGSGHGTDGNAQNTNNVYGTLLRLNIGGNNAANGQYGIPADNPFVDVAGVDEIYAYGLRNPFSFSFDALNGDLFLGDVGQNDIEELNVVVNGGNYGWPIKEGSFFFDPNGNGQGFLTTEPVRPVPPDLIDPVAEYDHDDGVSIIGGFVYRGTRVPGLYGRYVTGDFQRAVGASTGRLFYLDGDGAFKEFQIGVEGRELGLLLKGFGQDEEGEIYVMASSSLGPLSNGGRILKIVPATEPVAITSSWLTNDVMDLVLIWSGGFGPYTVQSQPQLGNPTWSNLLATNTTAATVPVLGPSAFMRIADRGLAAGIPFTAALSGAAQRPDPVDTDGGGFGSFVLEGHRLTFTIGYTNLSEAATAAHIHGPAPASEPADVMIHLGDFAVDGFGTSGTIAGSVILDDPQREAVLQGLTYVNIHTPANGSGEIRGQIAPVLWEAALSGAAERGTPVTTEGSGSGLFMLVGSTLTFQVDYAGLTGEASDAHIHGPATVHESAGVMVGLSLFNGGAFGESGRLAGTLELDPDQLVDVLEGLTYVNVHTMAHGSGEIRGQILPRPTSTPLSASLSGAAERPNPVATDGVGLGLFSVEGEQLTVHVHYSGLTGPATAAHIHGPATTADRTGVMIGIEELAVGEMGEAGVFSGTLTLTPLQKAHVLGGRTYVNIHTEANGSGEIRGQIVPVLIKNTMNGAAERMNPVDTDGLGFGLHLLVGDTLNVNLHYSGLSGPASSAHIHGPATTEQSATILIGLEGITGEGFGVSGRLWGPISLDPDQLGHVANSMTYINIHTGMHSSGEIRGQLSP